RFRPAGPAVGGAPVGGRPAAPDALAGERLVHQAEHGRFAVEEADKRTPERAAHDEGLGAVNGIDHPAKLARAVALAPAVLLTDDGMRGVMPLEITADDALGALVGGGDGIEPVCAALVLDGDRPAEVPEDELSGEIGKRVRGLEKLGERCG